MGEIFRPMLAETVTDVEALRFPLLASPKLDGIRAIVRGGQLLSRNLKPIPNDHIRQFLSRPALEGLDGELVCGPETDPNVYTRTDSGVMTKAGVPFFVYRVFDHFHQEHPFFSRLEEATRLSVLGMGKIVPVRHVVVEDAKALIVYEAEMVYKGYEGVMLRSMLGPYKCGRSTEREGWLLKVKRFADDEAIVLGSYEQLKNNNEATIDALGRTKRTTHKANKIGKDVLGGLHVRNGAGQEFDIGTGFDDATRARLWALHLAGKLAGLTVKYRHQPSGQKDLPRFPVFIGFRSDL